MSHHTYRIYYVPFPNLEKAKKMLQQLLEEKKIACANVFNEVKSLYWWQGKIEESSEVVVMMKAYNSPTEHESLKKDLHKLHPYDVPCITALKVEDVNEDFLGFLKKVQFKAKI